MDSEKWPYLQECQLSKDKSRYFDLRKIVENRKCKIFRFYPALSTEDAEQTEQILDFNVNIFPFRSKIHGIPFSKEALYDLIKLDSEEIEDIWRSVNNKKFVSKLSFYSKIKKSWSYGLKVYIRERTNEGRIGSLLKKLRIQKGENSL